jgi:hypothetical protein
MSLEPWHLLLEHRDYATATWRDIFCTIWRQETTEEGALRVGEACREFTKRHPRGIGLLTIIERGASVPTAPARNVLAAFLVEASASIRCSAVVFEGSGFHAAAVRGIVIGLSLITRQRFPHKVCDMREAERMFAELLPAATGVNVGNAAFRESLDELRKTIARR